MAYLSSTAWVLVNRVREYRSLKISEISMVKKKIKLSYSPHRIFVSDGKKPYSTHREGVISVRDLIIIMTMMITK